MTAAANWVKISFWDIRGVLVSRRKGASSHPIPGEAARLAFSRPLTAVRWRGEREDQPCLLLRHDFAASAPWDTDGDRPAGPPTPAQDAGRSLNNGQSNTREERRYSRETKAFVRHVPSSRLESLTGLTSVRPGILELEELSWTKRTSSVAND
jgi:hypothetical protein